MEFNKQQISKPYYEPSRNLRKQVQSGRKRRRVSVFKFIRTKIVNEILERMAYNCPVNSWRIRLHRLRGVQIGVNSFIGRRVTLDHSYPEYIAIGDNVSLAGDNYVLTHSNPYKHFENVFDSFVAPVIIEDGAWVSVGAIVLPGVQIGKNAVIGAGSVVNKDVPEAVFSAGMPAKTKTELKL